MSINCKATIIREIGKSAPYSQSTPLSIEDVTLDPPRVGEVLVKVAGAGLCNSDLAIISGKRPRPVPLAMGHEGSGEIVELGEGVRDLHVGDHVVFQFSASCGRCVSCQSGRPSICIPARQARTKGELMGGGTRIRDADQNSILHHAGVSCFAEYTVVDRGSLVVIDKDIPLADSAIFGCAVMTGAGAVINTAKVATGEKVAVIGLGGVGLNGIMAAKLCGAGQIIGIDIDDKKLELARELGATHTVNASSATCVEEVIDITNGGVDHAVELAGVMSAMETGWNILGRGGKLVTAGLTPEASKFAFQHDDLVVHPSNNCGFRAKEPFHRKTQLAGNGCSLFKSCNAAVGRLFGSLRARLLAPTDCVAQSKRRTTMPAIVGLVVNAGSHAEFVIIRWMDHQYRLKNLSLDPIWGRVYRCVTYHASLHCNSRGECQWNG